MIEYLTLNEVCERLKICRNTLTAWIKEGLPVMEFSPRLKRVRSDSLDEWLRRRFEGTRLSQGISVEYFANSQVVEKVGKVRS